MSDFEIPSAFTEVIRKAKKDHKCCECNQPIQKGESYQYCSGIWAGQPDSYKTCLSCLTLRNDYIKKTGEEFCFEGLRDCIANAFCRDYGPKEFLIDYSENETEFKKLFSKEFNQGDSK